MIKLVKVEVEQKLFSSVDKIGSSRGNEPVRHIIHREAFYRKNNESDTKSVFRWKWNFRFSQRIERVFQAKVVGSQKKVSMKSSGKQNSALVFAENMKNLIEIQLFRDPSLASFLATWFPFEMVAKIF